MPRLRPALLLLALAVTPLTGCKNSCRQLSEKLCECQATTVLREACLAEAARADARIGPNEADQVICARLLPGCDCHAIATAEGKQACGLSR